MLRQNNHRRPDNHRQLARISKFGGLAIAALGFATISPAGANEYWEQYFERSDTITVAPGDATDTNKAVQMITRWPRASRQDRWLSDGEVARRATVRYRTNRVTKPKTLTGKATNDMPDAADVPEPSAKKSAGD